MLKKLAASTVLLTLFGLGFTPSQPAMAAAKVNLKHPMQQMRIQELATHAITVRVGRSVGVTLRKHFERARVADGHVASSTIRGQAIVVTGKAPGRTTLTVWNKGQVVATYSVRVSK